MGEMGGGAERKTEMRELSRSAEENDDSEVRDDGDAQRRLREGAVRFELVDDGDRARGKRMLFQSLPKCRTPTFAIRPQFNSKRGRMVRKAHPR